MANYWTKIHLQGRGGSFLVIMLMLCLFISLLDKSLALTFCLCFFFSGSESNLYSSPKLWMHLWINFLQLSSQWNSFILLFWMLVYCLTQWLVFAWWKVDGQDMGKKWGWFYAVKKAFSPADPTKVVDKKDLVNNELLP